jgi:hypothetical protein
MARRKDSFTRPFAIVYYHTTGGMSWNPKMIAAKGTTTSLVNARGRVAMHIAREDYYPRAIILDRRTGKIVTRMWRQTDGSIHRKDE